MVPPPGRLAMLGVPPRLDQARANTLRRWILLVDALAVVFDRQPQFPVLDRKQAHANDAPARTGWIGVLERIGQRLDGE
jgi:hypothetical protein